jgi:hypothetical protein
MMAAVAKTCSAERLREGELPRVDLRPRRVARKPPIQSDERTRREYGIERRRLNAQWSEHGRDRHQDEIVLRSREPPQKQRCEDRMARELGRENEKVQAKRTPPQERRCSYPE